MQEGITLLDTLRKVITYVSAGLILLGFIYPISLFIGCIITIANPIFEGIIAQFYKWYHRGKTQMEMFLTEEEGAWEKLNFEIIKVVPFKSLPDTLHEAYLNRAKERYENIVEKHSTKKVEQLVYKNISLPDDENGGEKQKEQFQLPEDLQIKNPEKLSYEVIKSKSQQKEVDESE